MHCRKVGETVPKQKKNSRGYYVKYFAFEGKSYKVYGKTQDEILEKVAAKKKELAEGEENLQNPTLESYYEQFTDIRRCEIEESTIRGQKYQFRNISSVIMENGKPFGKMRMRDITRKHIEYARQKLLKGGKTPQYLNICFAHLNHVFETAVIDDTIIKNPCKALKKLKREGRPISETRHRALSEADVVKFLKAADERPSFFRYCFKLMFLTGMRIGEVGALYLTDIDDMFIHIRRGITRDEVGCYIVGEDPKTESGVRDIPLTPELRKVISDQCDLNRMVFGTKWTGLLFKSPEGEILREYTVNREIKRICTSIGIEYFTCHAARITFATRFIEQRPHDFKILSEIMGHKDVDITLNLYTRVMNENKILAMNDLKVKTDF